jgi:hypothetical protein
MPILFITKSYRDLTVWCRPRFEHSPSIRLAEFLCLLPLVLRVPVLALLGPAEAVARAFAIKQIGGALALPPRGSRAT